MPPRGNFFKFFKPKKIFIISNYRNSPNWLNVLMDRQTGPGLLHLEFKRGVTVSVFYS